MKELGVSVGMAGVVFVLLGSLVVSVAEGIKVTIGLPSIK
jgi:hypothetical protein